MSLQSYMKTRCSLNFKVPVQNIQYLAIMTPDNTLAYAQWKPIVIGLAYNIHKRKINGIYFGLDITQCILLYMAYHPLYIYSACKNVISYEYAVMLESMLSKAVPREKN